MTFEKHLRSVSRAASQWLGILRNSWQVFHDRSLLGRCLRGFVLPVLEYCSAVWCSAADTHHRLLDRVVSSASFLTGCVIECDLAHRRSVAVLCIILPQCGPRVYWCKSVGRGYCVRVWAEGVLCESGADGVMCQCGLRVYCVRVWAVGVLCESLGRGCTVWECEPRVYCVKGGGRACTV